MEYITSYQIRRYIQRRSPRRPVYRMRIMCWPTTSPTVSPRLGINGLDDVFSLYFVAAELSSRGIIASITLRNSRGIDIIASSGDASRSVTIQVKTSSGGSPKRILTKKSESNFDKNHFYVFVLLHGVGNRPDFYVVPSMIVADYISTTHKQWLDTLQADGSKRKDSAGMGRLRTRDQPRVRTTVLFRCAGWNLFRALAALKKRGIRDFQAAAASPGRIVLDYCSRQTAIRPSAIGPRSIMRQFSPTPALAAA